MSLTIKDGMVVSLEYVLHDTAGEELDRSAEDKPLLYLHGARNIVPGLEKGLVGKSAGEEFRVEVPAAEGYGPKQKAPKVRLRRSQFPEDLDLAPGMSFQTQAPNGQHVTLWVLKLQGAQVVCTPLHPLVGQDLVFTGKVVEVREASEDEKSHGHAHGAGGHEHGGDTKQTTSNSAKDDPENECCGNCD